MTAVGVTCAAYSHTCSQPSPPCSHLSSSPYTRTRTHTVPARFDTSAWGGVPIPLQAILEALPRAQNATICRQLPSEPPLPVVVVDAAVTLAAGAKALTVPQVSDCVRPGGGAGTRDRGEGGRLGGGFQRVFVGCAFVCVCQTKRCDGTRRTRFF